MEWDQAKIDAAVSTLTEALGTICDVSIEHNVVSKETGRELLGLPIMEYVCTETIITITPREE